MTEPADVGPEAQRPRQRRTAAAMLAAGMLGLDETLGRKPREEIPVIVDANGNPVDIDADGIELLVADASGDEVAVVAPPQPRSRPAAPVRGRRRRGRSG